MKYPIYSKIMVVAVCFGLFGSAVLFAQEPKPVYLVRPIGQTEVWAMNMGVQTEALRLYVPTSFERKGKAVTLSFDTPSVSFRSDRETIILRTGDVLLSRYEVVITGAAPLPKVDRSMTIRFSLAELGASESMDTGTPGSYALRQAILTGPYSRGRAWVQSIDFSDDRFAVVVGLKR
jgi:hypothetical protein